MLSCRELRRRTPVSAIRFRQVVKPRIENIPLTLGGELHLFEKTSVVYVLPGAAKGFRSHVAPGEHRQGSDHER